MLRIGTELVMTHTVTQADTAMEVGSGTLPVLATPRLIAWMEEASWKAVVQDLEPDTASVGGSMTIHHLAPTPVGCEVTVTTRLTDVSGRHLTFLLEAKDSCGLIANATHERVVIDSNRFLQKANQKLGGGERV